MEISFQTAAHELGHALGMAHDYKDDGTLRSYIDPVTHEEYECSGFMDVPTTDIATGQISEPPAIWSECSVNDFRRAYISNDWGKICFGQTPTTTVSPTTGE